MAKSLNFSINGSQYNALPVKIERKKLYGYGRKIVLDENGKECETANLDEGASGIIAKGGLGLGILSPEGLWVDRSSLKAVDNDGKDLTLSPSSYDLIINLNKKIAPDFFLDYCITGFYELQSPSLSNAIGNDIYMFSYCYRASYEPQTAFILANDESAFLLIGYKAELEMLSLPQEAVIDEEGNEEDSDDEEIDFSMM